MLVPGTQSIQSLVTSAMRSASAVHSKASSPSTSAEPPTGRRFPANKFSKLDLPAPLDPTSTTLAPRRIFRLMSLHTRVVPYAQLTSSRSIAASSAISLLVGLRDRGGDASAVAHTASLSKH